MKSGDSIRQVLLTGATSQVGVFALGRLLAEGFRVMALSRQVSRQASIDYIPAPGNVQWLHPGSLASSSNDPVASAATDCLLKVEAVFSCGPLLLAQELVPHCPGLRRVIAISTSSLYTKLDSADPAERALVGGIKQSEDALKALCNERDIALLLLRPTLIYGCGLDQNISRMARLVQRYRFLPLAGKASGLRQPIHADDLASIGLAALEAEKLENMESPVGGGSVLSYREMAEKVFTAFSLKPRLVSIPPGLLATLARMASWLPGSEGLNAEFAYRQNRDFVFDDAELRQVLTFKTRPFSPKLDDFKVPDELKSLQPFPASGL